MHPTISTAMNDNYMTVGDPLGENSNVYFVSSMQERWMDYVVCVAFY